MTLAELASLVCLASGIFGRPAMDAEACREKASAMLEAAARHDVDPTLVLAIDVLECELRDDVHRRATRWGRRGRSVVYDACPMGVRVTPEELAGTSAGDRYEAAASRLAYWRSYCAKGHPGKHREIFARRGRHHYVAHYNWGNPSYAPRVLAVAAALGGRRVRHADVLGDRVVAFVNRIYRALGLPWRLKEVSS